MVLDEMHTTQQKQKRETGKKKKKTKVIDNSQKYKKKGILHTLDGYWTQQLQQQNP